MRAITRYVMHGQDTSAHANQDSKIFMRYVNDGYRRFLDSDGYPAIKPPWGTLNAINLNTGEYAWKIPLGEYPKLAAQGLANTGSENYGGPVVTAGGLVFIAATSDDKKFRAFDKTTGKLLWETKLPAAGNATPATYQVNGRQFVVIAAGGGKSPDPSGATIVAFALPVGVEHASWPVWNSEPNPRLVGSNTKRGTQARRRPEAWGTPTAQPSPCGLRLCGTPTAQSSPMGLRLCGIPILSYIQ
jgi:outer membrane protein assembly factor BamB